MDDAYALDAQRLAEDVTDGLARRPSAEDILARAMERIQQGTYTEAPQFSPAVADAYLVSHPACGEVTEFGTCASRYHDPGCGAVIAAAAATGTAEDAGAWAATLRNRPPDPDALPYSAELAEPSGPDGTTDTWADLLAPPAADPRTVHARALAALGEDPGPEPGYEPFGREQYPDTSGLRTALGL
jgi:hypothetical protein